MHQSELLEKKIKALIEKKNIELHSNQTLALCTMLKGLNNQPLASAIVDKLEIINPEGVYLLNQKKIRNINQLCALREQFPEQASIFVQPLIHNKSEFKRLVRLYLDLHELLVWFPDYADFWIQYFLADLECFQDLLSYVQVLIELKKSFSNPADKLMEKLIQERDIFKNLVTGSAEFLLLSKYFPQFVPNLLEILFEDGVFLQKIIKNERDFQALKINFPNLKIFQLSSKALFIPALQERKQAVFELEELIKNLMQVQAQALVYLKKVRVFNKTLQKNGMLGQEASFFKKNPKKEVHLFTKLSKVMLFEILSYTVNFKYYSRLQIFTIFQQAYDKEHKNLALESGLSPINK